MDSAISVTTVQDQLSAKIMELLDRVVDERRQHYASHPDEETDVSDVGKIISRYALLNSSISGTIGLVPGPMGMLAAIPEIALVLSYQMNMICDIGRAYNKTDVLAKELIAGVLMSSVGLGGIGLVTMRGGKVIVNRASLRVLQSVVSMLGGKLTQAALRSALSKWVPVVGAAGMAVWSNVSTRRIGHLAAEVFSKPIEIVDGEPDSDSSSKCEVSVGTGDDTAAVQRISVFVNLAKKDGISPEERSWLEQMISAAGLDKQQSGTLCAQLEAPGYEQVDYNLLRQSPDEALQLLVDLVTLAMADGKASACERVSLRQVGRALDLTEQDINEIVASGIES